MIQTPMQQRTLRVLEFTKIREELASLALTPMGAERCRALEPSHDLTEAQTWQRETEEAVVVLQYVGGNPLTASEDVRPWLSLAEKGATLAPRALLAVANMLRASRCARDALVTDRQNTPSLTEIAAALSDLRHLEQDITDAIISEDEIADRASTALADIRRHLRGANERIKDKLNAMLRSPVYAEALQDTLITVRGGRYVIPVRADHRSMVPGLVHDQSASGATLFIEPMAAVEMGNELKQWEIKEKQEIERILAALSAGIAPYADSLREDVNRLAELDFIFAKGLLSRRMRGTTQAERQRPHQHRAGPPSPDSR